MAEGVFEEVAGLLVTSGEWDATIEVFLTDNNPGFAHTTFDSTFSVASVDDMEVLVVGAWAMIVGGAEDLNGPAQADGAGAEFAIHFNVTDNDDNAGLLRHELMHGFGAVNAIPWPTMSAGDQVGGLIPGERWAAALYDLALADATGAPLLDDYDDADGTFVVQDYAVDATFTEWTDGEAGLVFVGEADGGGELEMDLGTFPDGDGAVVRLNEPALR